MKWSGELKKMEFQVSFFVSSFFEGMVGLILLWEY